MARERRQEWVKRIARWRDSGLTAREFAAEIGINEHTLRHWAWRLRSDGDGSTAPPTRARPSADANAVRFVEVSAPDIGPQTIMALEIILPGGATIRVPSQFDDGVLRRVIAVLEAGA